MLTTIEEINQQFVQDAGRRFRAGLTRFQAEIGAARQIIKDAKAGEIDLEAAKEFVISIEITKGSTREAARVLVENLLAGKDHGFFEIPWQGFTKPAIQPGA